MTDLLLHVGYPKAASTTLQNQLFVNLHKAGRINFLGRAFESGVIAGTSSRDAYKDWFGSVASGSADASRENFLRIFPPLAAGKVNVFSEGRFITHEDEPQRFVIAPRLKAFFGPQADRTRVLIVLRSQTSLMISYYVQKYVKMKETTFSEFIDRNIERGWSGEPKVFNERALVESYASAFGKENIHIVFFEDLSKNRERFCSEVGDALCVPAEAVDQGLEAKRLNVSQIQGEHYIVEKQNTYTVRGLARIALGKLGLGTGLAEIRLPLITEQEKQKIFDAFRSSNRQLAEDFNLDQERMKEYRYL